MRDTIAQMSTRGQSIYDLKMRGHNMLDGLRYLDISRGRAYQLLAKELGVPEPQAHFSQMHTYEEVTRAIAALRKIERLAGRWKYAANTKAKTAPVAIPPPPAPKPKSPSITMNVPRGGVIADPAIVREALREVTRHNALRAERRKRYWFLAWLIQF